jgi:hypothetical protein
MYWASESGQDTDRSYKLLKQMVSEGSEAHAEPNLRVRARGHRDLVTIIGHAAAISAGNCS